MAALQGTSWPVQWTAAGDLTGSTVTLTVTAPDGSTSTPTVTTSAATASARVPALQVGTYLLVWSVTGALTASTVDQFTVVAPSAALISLTDLRDELHLTDTSKDAKLRRWLDSATPVIENVTGPILPRPKTDYFDGDVPQVVLTARWVSKITTVVETWGATNFTLTEQPLGASVDAYGYTWDRATNTVTRRTYGGAPANFQPGIRTVAVSYTSGLTTIPADIQLATAELIKHWYRKNETPFRAAVFGAQAGDDAMNMPGNYMVPNAVMELLEPWRRPPGIF